MLGSWTAAQYELAMNTILCYFLYWLWGSSTPTKIEFELQKKSDVDVH